MHVDISKLEKQFSECDERAKKFIELTTEYRVSPNGSRYLAVVEVGTGREVRTSRVTLDSRINEARTITLTTFDYGGQHHATP